MLNVIWRSAAAWSYVLGQNVKNVSSLFHTILSRRQGLVCRLREKLNETVSVVLNLLHELPGALLLAEELPEAQRDTERYSSSKADELNKTVVLSTVSKEQCMPTYFCA